MRQDQLTVEIACCAGRVTLRVTGEIDMSTAPSVHEAAICAIRLHPTLDIDLSAVTFMDSSGLHVLLATKKRADIRGGSLRLLHPTPAVMRVLEVTGVDGLFEIETDHSSATGR